MKVRPEKKKVNTKLYLTRYGDQMTRMSVGKVIYVTHFGERTRIQRVGDGVCDYVIEPWSPIRKG